MSDPVFNAVMHEPTRVQVCGILAAVEEVEFRTVRDTIGIADSVTSKHLKTLVEAGYVPPEKRGVESRPRTWARLTPAGRTAFAAHVAELRRLAALADGSPVGSGE